MKNARTRGLALLFNETVALYLRLSADAAAIHAAGTLSGPRRTLLSALQAGPQTVSHLARSRAQTRQRLQPIVNALVRDGLVEAIPNPMHKRSPLMRLTASGQEYVRDMLEKEGALLARLRPRSSATELLDAAAVLHDARETLGEQLPELLRSAPAKGRPARRGRRRNK
ncbi:MAG TPA: MarR family winged helix-turn-helix transcriptional regulator [Vicinamibacterales bacterium]|nr:MarR family winged helix-turn-helix transcriptional regulator [Vicinamibacterales bacterium]